MVAGTMRRVMGKPPALPPVGTASAAVARGAGRAAGSSIVAGAVRGGGAMAAAIGPIGVFVAGLAAASIALHGVAKAGDRAVERLREFSPQIQAATAAGEALRTMQKAQLAGQHGDVLARREANAQRQALAWEKIETKLDAFFTKLGQPFDNVWTKLLEGVAGTQQQGDLLQQIITAIESGNADIKDLSTKAGKLTEIQREKLNRFMWGGMDLNLCADTSPPLPVRWAGRVFSVEQGIGEAQGAAFTVPEPLGALP